MLANSRICNQTERQKSKYVLTRSICFSDDEDDNDLTLMRTFVPTAWLQLSWRHKYRWLWRCFQWHQHHWTAAAYQVNERELSLNNNERTWNSLAEKIQRKPWFKGKHSCRLCCVFVCLSGTSQKRSSVSRAWRSDSS